MSTMLTPSRPRARAISATVPGWFGTVTRSSVSGPPASSASSSARRSSRAPVCQALTASASPAPMRAAAASRRFATDSTPRATASRLVAKMSPQIAGLAPATRVVSRKLGPTSGMRSASSASADAASWTRAFAKTCGRWLTVAITRSCVAASSARGRAPSSVTARWMRSKWTPLERSVGVRYQRAPSKRSARAFSTPAVSAPASGWPPMNRSSPPSASTSSPLVEPTSVTTVSGPEAASASRACSGSAATGPAQNTRSAPSQASATEPAPRSIAPSSTARASRSGRRPQPTTSASSRRRAASPIEPPIRPTPRTAIFMDEGAASDAAPGLHCGSEPLQGRDGVVPVDAGVGDRLPVDELLAGDEVLPTLDQERLQHHADDRLVAVGHLVGDVAGGEELLLRVLAAVVVGGVDHQPLRQACGAEGDELVFDLGRVVVRLAVAAAEDQVAIGVAGRVQDRRLAGVVDAGEGVRRRRRPHRVDRDLDVAVGPVLEADRHREAGGELAVGLALRGASPDRPPGHAVGDVLRRDRVEELAADRQPAVQH